MSCAYKYNATDGRGWYLASIGGKARFLIGNGSVLYLDDTVFITNSWHRLTGIKSGTTFQLFVDLRLIGSNTYTILDTADPVRIGARYSYGSIDMPMNGYIGITAIYTNTFSGLDVTNTFNAEKGRYGL
jgi:hypothetical protein